MRLIKLLLSLSATVLLIYFLAFPQGDLAFAPGEMLDPFRGFWQNANPVSGKQQLTYSFVKLEQPVTVKYDERKVPHIFAQNIKDLVFAQGFVTAQQRLWQMDFTAMLAAGRLSEIIRGNNLQQAFENDRMMRRQGMVYAAQQSLDMMLSHPESRTVIEAFNAGVNAYIQSLKEKDFPLEYKLLNYKPEPWTPLKSMLVFKYMAYDLAGRQSDLSQTRAIQHWGPALFDTLYPLRNYVEDPIVPIEVQWSMDSISIPQPPANYSPAGLLREPLAFLTRPEDDPALLGSNNWAISGAKSATGSPMLANDPHLGLNLPSVWFETQLHTPELNVYGVTIPGLPLIIIGYNDSIAWGLTNAGRDVMDFYKISYQDPSRKAYLHGGKWRSTTQKIETYKLSDGRVIQDTVIYTALGPVMYDKGFGDAPFPLVCRWVPQQPSNDLLTFIKMAKGKNYKDYEGAIRHFVSPAQNFVYAGSEGTIGIWQQGRFPKLWKDQGRFLLDAADSSHIWTTYVPLHHNPHIVNPIRGYVSSANQHPAGPTYPYLYHSTSFENYRNRRLNYLLANSNKLSIEDMKRIQQDSYGVMAEDLLPVILAELDLGEFTADERKVYDILKEWDYYYHAGSVAATFFEVWKDSLYVSLWKDEYKDLKGVAYPSLNTTIGILKTLPVFRFYDDVGTSFLETRRYLINATFRKTVAGLMKQTGDIAKLSWGTFKAAEIRHLLRIGPFSRLGLNTGGNSRTLNAHSRYSGPSWRMIVSLGKQTEAFGIYPGGQSGNVGDKAYDAFIDDWAAGRYYTLWKMKGPDDSNGKITGTLIFNN